MKTRQLTVGHKKRLDNGHPKSRFNCLALFDCDSSSAGYSFKIYAELIEPGIDFFLKRGFKPVRLLSNRTY